MYRLAQSRRLPVSYRLVNLRAKFVRGRTPDVPERTYKGACTAPDEGFGPVIEHRRCAWTSAGTASVQKYNWPVLAQGVVTDGIQICQRKGIDVVEHQGRGR